MHENASDGRGSVSWTQSQCAIGARLVRFVLVPRGESSMVQPVHTAHDTRCRRSVAACVGERRVDGSRTRSTRRQGGKLCPVGVARVLEERQQPDCRAFAQRGVVMAASLVVGPVDLDHRELAHPARAEGNRRAHFLGD
jgi:hypothetical protein